MGRRYAAKVTTTRAEDVEVRVTAGSEDEAKSAALRRATHQVVGDDPYVTEVEEVEG
jgi:hypothetical protein